MVGDDDVRLRGTLQPAVHSHHLAVTALGELQDPPGLLRKVHSGLSRVGATADSEMLLTSRAVDAQRVSLVRRLKMRTFLHW